MKKLGLVLLIFLQGVRVASGQSISHHTHASPNDVSGAMMDTMMSRMGNVSKKDGVDFLFVHQMIPHHQAAIDMAKAVLRFTEVPRIRAFAWQIISSQQVEIEQMAHYLK